MGSAIARGLLGLMLAFVTATASAASAAEPARITKYFPVCVRPIPGVTHIVRVGIDAAEGQFLGQGGAVDYMIGYNPSLPASMGRGVREGRLTESLQLLAESDGPLQKDAYGKPIGYGVERLYGLSNGDVDTPKGPIQEKIFVQLWADGHGQNVRLLKKVGDALSRCPK
jgi:hypothetical protein